MNDRPADRLLICRVQTRLCALPLEHVVETLRPLPIEALAGSPRFVRGLALIRGCPVPVIDTACLLGDQDAPAGRFVTINAGGRRVALAVNGVLGVRAVAAGSQHRLPPLLQEAGADVVASIGLLDAELLLVLNSTRLLPDDAWAACEASGAAP